MKHEVMMPDGKKTLFPALCLCEVQVQEIYIFQLSLPECAQV